MKHRILILTLLLFFVVGCSMNNNPSSVVEEVLTKYKRVDGDIRAGINDVISRENLSQEHADRYEELLIKQYRDLSYEIKDEVIDGNKATVTVSISVYDFKNAIGDMTFDSTIYTKESFDEEKLTRLESVKDKVMYTMTLELEKDKDYSWRLKALTNEQIKKIQGMY